MRQKSLGAASACVMCVSMAASGRDFTKSPFQYHCRPLGKNGSNRALIDGKGISLIQLKIGAGNSLSSGARSRWPSTADPLYAPMIAQARFPQPSLGNGSIDGTVLR